MGVAWRRRRRGQQATPQATDGGNPPRRLAAGRGGVRAQKTPAAAPDWLAEAGSVANGCASRAHRAMNDARDEAPRCSSRRL